MPQATPTLPGNVKVTQDDWLKAARTLLVDAGVSEVKILTLSDRLGVSRSSFYWYFRSRADLLDRLLANWEDRNTGTVLAHAGMAADGIVAAVCNVFLCVIDPDGFDHRLDFAVREWARRDKAVRAAVDRSDTARTEAIAAMFIRHGFAPDEADIRARVLYYQQIGYYALDLDETLDDRLARVPAYLFAFTGVRPDPAALTAFEAEARRRTSPGGDTPRGHV